MLEKLLRRYGDKLLQSYFVGALVPLFLYETEFNEPFDMAFEHLTIPIVLVSFAVFWFGVPEWKEEVGILKGSLYTLLAAGLITLMSGAYIIGINAWVGEQTEVRIQGEVTSKWVSHGRRSETHHITVRDPETGESTQLNVSESVYSRVEEGERYERTWHVGSLGLLYR